MAFLRDKTLVLASLCYHIANRKNAIKRFKCGGTKALKMLTTQVVLIS